MYMKTLAPTCQTELSKMGVPLYCFIDPLNPGGEILVRCLLLRTTLTYKETHVHIITVTPSVKSKLETSINGNDALCL